MKGLLKVILGIIGVLVILIIAAAIIIPMYVDPNDYKDEITALVKKQTGRDLQIPGDLEITVFPWLGVETGRLVLSNAEGFGDEPMVAAEHVEVRVKLLPLLRKEIEMGTVVLDDLQANLARNEEGRTNWDDLIQAPEQPAEEEKKSMALAGLAVGGLDINNGRVSWTDRQAGQRYVIDQLNLETGALEPGEPIDLDLSMAVDASNPQLKGTLALAGTVNYDLDQKQYRITPLTLEADLEGPQLPGGAADINLSADTIAADLQAQTASIKALSLSALDTSIEGDIEAQNIDRQVPGLKGYVEIDGDDLPALLRALGQTEMADKIQSDAASEFALNAEFDTDAEAGTAAIDELEASILGVQIDGSLSASGTNSDDPSIEGELKLVGENLRDLLAVAGQEQAAENLKSLTAEARLSGTRQSLKLEPLTAQAVFAGDALPQGPVDVKLSANGQADLAQETVNIPDLTVKGMGLDIEGSVNAKGILSDPAYNGALKVAPFNLRQLMQQLALEVPETSDPNVLTQVGVDTLYTGTTNSLNLSKMSLKLDDSTATGTLGVADFAKQALRFDLNIDDINADRYLPPKPEGGEAPATPETAATGAATELPVETLRRLNMQGKLKVGKLVINKATLNNVSLALNADKGKIALAPVSANLYEGQYQGAVNIDASGQTPALNFDTNLSNVNIEPLLRDMTGEEAKLTGTGNITANLKAQGADTDSMKETLNGTASLLFKNGAYRGLNLGHILRQASAVLDGQSLKSVPDEQETDFSELTGTLNIQDGVIKNDDLAAKSPAIRVAGEGQASLVNEQVDYTVKASVAKTTEGQGGEGLDAVGGYTVPVRCKGTFSEPGCKPDFEGLAKAKIDKAVDEKTDEVKKKVEEKIQKEIGEGVGDKLKDALQF